MNKPHSSPHTMNKPHSSPHTMNKPKQVSSMPQPPLSLRLWLFAIYKNKYQARHSPCFPSGSGCLLFIKTSIKHVAAVVSSCSMYLHITTLLSPHHGQAKTSIKHATAPIFPLALAGCSLWKQVSSTPQPLFSLWLWLFALYKNKYQACHSPPFPSGSGSLLLIVIVIVDFATHLLNWKEKWLSISVYSVLCLLVVHGG